MAIRVEAVLRHRRTPGALSVLLAGNVAAYAASLALRDTSHYSPLWDLWFTNLILVLPILACFARAIVGGPRRAGSLWLGVAMLAFAVGSVIFVGVDAVPGRPARPVARRHRLPRVLPVRGRRAGLPAAPRAARRPRASGSTARSARRARRPRWPRS